MRPTEHLLVLAETTAWIEAALVIFVVVFIAIVGWVLLARPGAFKKAAQIPLDDDVVTPRVGGGNQKDQNTTADG